MQTPESRTPSPLWRALLAAGVPLLLLPMIACMAWLWLQWAALSSSAPWFVDTIRYAFFLSVVVFPVWGIGTLITILWRRYGWKESIFADKQAEMMRATRQIAPHATSFTYHDAHQVTAAPPMLAAQTPQSAGLPGALDLSALDCNPTIDHILLGVDEQGQITVSVPDLCHVALLGSTGGGKSNLLRLIIPQLQRIGASVILADPHFAPIDPENGDDWRPIADRLIHAPAVTADAIDQELSFMLEELERRLEKRRQNLPIGAPLFFAFDELPVICDLVNNAPKRLGKLLREGRKVSLLTIGASQSMLIKEVGGSSTLRDQYRTAFYVGGDRKSAAAVLDLPERDIDDGPLGKGIVLLRSKSTSPARLVRVPLVSNASLYELLGVAVAPQIAPTEPLPMGFHPAPKTQTLEGAPVGAVEGASSAAPSSASGRASALSPEAARALALIRDGKSISEVIKEMFGVSAGRAYQEKTVWLMEVIRANLQARGAPQ